MTDSHENTGTLLASNVMGTPGATLRAAREKAGLTLDEVAGKTKMSVLVLQAIEHDDFASLGRPVYVRGYLRRYAKAMAVPESEVLSEFDANSLAPPSQEPAREPVEGVEESPGSRPMLWLLVIIILAAIAGAAVLYFKGIGPDVLMRRPAVKTRPAPIARPVQPQPAPVEVAPAAEPSPEPASEAPKQAAPAAEGTAAPPAANPAVPGGPPPVNQPEPGAAPPAPQPQV